MASPSSLLSGTELMRKSPLLHLAFRSFLVGAAALMLSCGDFELWGERNQGGGSGPEPTPQECDNVFPGLPYPAVSQETTLFGEPLALAVVPKGMSFSFTSSGLGTVSVQPGDLLLADREDGAIYLRKYSAPAAQQGVIPFKEGLKDPGGIALFQLEVTGVGGGTATYNLLFYSQTDSNRASEKGFVTVEIPGTSISVEVNATVPLNLAQATSLAVGSSGSTTGLFILGDRSKVIRVGVTVASGVPLIQGSHTLLQGTTASSYREVAFFQGTGDLFVIQSTIPLETDVIPAIFRIQNAVTENGTITNPKADISSASFTTLTPTGMTLAFQTQDEASAYLLVMNRGTGSDQIQQFNAATGIEVAGTYSPVGINRYLTAIAYDCTNSRLFMTDSPITFNATGDGLLYWATP